MLLTELFGSQQIDEKLSKGGLLTAAGILSGLAMFAGMKFSKGMNPSDVGSPTTTSHIPPIASTNLPTVTRNPHFHHQDDTVHVTLSNEEHETLNHLSKPLAQNLIKSLSSSNLKGDELLQFLAQCAIETNYFRTLSETGGRKEYNHYDIRYNPKIAKQLGNIHPGDGARYRGRSYLDITGRKNYHDAGLALDIPLEKHPDLASKPEIAVKIALWYWKTRVQNVVSDFNDVHEVTKAINGSTNALDKRTTEYHNLKKIFSKPQVAEGGNVEIDGIHAQRIDLNNTSRESLLPLLSKTLTDINSAYQSQYKKPLWNPTILANNGFLSGSAYHFFDQNIPHDEFLKVKPMVGDIDTKVDKADKNNIQSFLNSIKGTTIGDAKFVGYKIGSNQYITLWTYSQPPINLQIDFELVDYDTNGPTEWSNFSHSSSWDDLKIGVKGVFHKYLLRALTTNTLKERVIELKSGKHKKVTSTDIAFSVLYGMREKYAPVMDGNNQKQIDGLPVYREISTVDSDYVNTTAGMFKMVFGVDPTKDELTQFSSYVGCLELINSHSSNEEKEKIIHGFILTLFGSSAQQLYKDDPTTDRSEKFAALNKMISVLGMQSYYDSYQSTLHNLVQTFYQRYGNSKFVTATESVEMNVLPSPRKGIKHFQKMNNQEFLEFIQYVKNDLNGKIDPMKMTLKIDGLGARFGKDTMGRVFFESSNSGPVFTPGKFKSYAESKGFTGTRLDRALHYEEMFRIITNSDFIKSLPNDTKVNCEILYNPMAQETNEGLKFVNISYDRSYLGENMTIIPFDTEIASTGERYSQSDKIKDQLISLNSENGIKFIDDRLISTDEINIMPIILHLESNEFNANILEDSKEEIANMLITNENLIGLRNMGDNVEGIILHKDNQPFVKITTNRFKKALKDKLSRD